MKSRQFKISSLFEGKQYITLYDKQSGMEIGRLCKHGSGYIAQNCINGQKATVQRKEQAEDLSRNGRTLFNGAELLQDKRKIKEFAAVVSNGN